MKRIFAIIMAICLLASMLCITTVAAEATDGLVLRVSALKDDGSLALIVAFVALIASVASIIVNVTARKKKTVPVTKTESSEEGN